LSKSNREEFWTSGKLKGSREVPDEFRPTWNEFCHPPGAKFSQFRPTATHELAISKRLARAQWGEIHRISPHEKKKKISLGRNSKDPIAKPLAFHDST
jgi:hypothetical protein